MISGLLRDVAQPVRLLANPSDGHLNIPPGKFAGRRWTLLETGHRNGE